MKYLFVINPLSGGKSKRAFVRMLESRMDGLDYSVAYTARPGHAAEIVRECDGDVVVAVGGDGTVNEVVSGLLGTDKILGIIPFGSGNGLARHLGIPMDREKALERLLAGDIHEMDCAKVNGDVFACTCGVGLDAAVGARFAGYSGRGPLSYVRAAVAEWFGFVPTEYEIWADGEHSTVKASMITVANANQWGNNAFVAPMASVCDGFLDLVVVGPLHLYQLPGLLVRMVTKGLRESSVVHYRRARNIVIVRENAGCAHRDGEPVTMGRRIEIAICEKAVRLKM